VTSDLQKKINVKPTASPASAPPIGRLDEAPQSPL